MNRIEIESFLNRLPDVKALVIGDLMLDVYLWGSTERISPEAPVQVVDVHREDLRLGGAGNVVNNLLSLGCQVRMASVLGEDQNGAVLLTRLGELELDIEGVLTSPDRTTSRKTRILASNQQMMRIDRESRDPIPPIMEEQLLAYVRKAGRDCGVILVSDYQKGVLTEKVLQEVITFGREQGIPVVIDPKGDDFTKYRGATLLTPNRKEAQAAARMPITDEGSLIRVGRHLRESLDLDALVLTRSEQGMTIFPRSGAELHLSTEAKEVYDVSGAGDTVLCVFGVGLAGGLSLEEAAILSNIAAGIVVGKVGTSTVSSQEILYVAEKSHPDTDLKIKDRSVLASILDREREKGRKIAFTNGCFDLLHVGHVKYLQKARRLGDLLVLGLNSDDSIRRLKGSKRPLIDQEERAHILAALDCIDYVAIFDEETPLELIRMLRPDILVKGGDYAPEGVVGRELVESWGGRVELVQFVDGRSTTNIIEKILQQYREE